MPIKPSANVITSSCSIVTVPKRVVAMSMRSLALNLEKGIRSYRKLRIDSWSMLAVVCSDPCSAYCFAVKFEIA